MRGPFYDHISFFAFLEQLWQLNSQNQLENFNDIWMYSNFTWNIPDSGKSGYITDVASNLVLTLSGRNSGTEVVLKEKGRRVNEQSKQRWKRSKANTDGWFTLKNQLFSLFLNRQSIEKVTAEGKKTHIAYFFYIILTVSDFCCLFS